jgi:threonine dehydratase
VPCRIVVPVGANPEKMAAMRAMGAEVTEFGRDFDEAREHVEDLAAREGWRYVHNANEPDLIAGVGTYALEIFEALPDVDYLFVPIGGGSGAAACGIVRSARGSRAKIVGVQAAGADAFARSWRGHERVTTERTETFAEGLATRVTFDLTFGILEQHLDDVVTLTEGELRQGVRASLGLTHNLAEGAGAAPIAAAYQYGARIADTRVVCVMSGGNIDAATLKAVLS